MVIVNSCQKQVQLAPLTSLSLVAWFLSCSRRHACPCSAHSSCMLLVLPRHVFRWKKVPCRHLVGHVPGVRDHARAVGICTLSLACPYFSHSEHLTSQIFCSEGKCPCSPAQSDPWGATWLVEAKCMKETRVTSSSSSSVLSLNRLSDHRTLERTALSLGSGESQFSKVLPDWELVC